LSKVAIDDVVFNFEIAGFVYQAFVKVLRKSQYKRKQDSLLVNPSILARLFPSEDNHLDFDLIGDNAHWHVAPLESMTGPTTGHLVEFASDFKTSI
jgi:hypothetical protein